METLQWTLLLGLLAMLVYVLWHRMRASFVEGVAPEVAADWDGEAVRRQGEALAISVRVKRAGKVAVWLEGPEGQRTTVADEVLEKGLHTWEVVLPNSEGWTVRMQCPGHRSERRLT
jgi:hypothetical protein